MLQAKVSVIIPIFNSAKFLQTAVNSALSFEVVGEVILIDDGSSDNSYDLCINIEKDDQRIKVVHHRNHINYGVSESRNLGIQIAQYSIIAFLDSDDNYLPNRFDESLKLLEADPTIDACFGRVLKKFELLGKERVIGFLKKKESESVLTYLFKGGYFHTNSITVRKEFFSKVGFFNKNLVVHEDVELWIRMAYQGNLVSIESKDPIAIYNIHGKNLSDVFSWNTKSILWKQIFSSFFFKEIGFVNRINILKQLIKCFLFK